VLSGVGDGVLNVKRKETIFFKWRQKTMVLVAKVCTLVVFWDYIESK